MIKVIHTYDEKFRWYQRLWDFIQHLGSNITNIDSFLSLLYPCVCSFIQETFTEHVVSTRHLSGGDIFLYEVEK